MPELLTEDHTHAAADDACWYNALTATERRQAATDTTPPAGDFARARRRLDRWRGQVPFNLEATLFTERLAADGYDESSLLNALAMEGPELRQRVTQAPDWVANLDAAFHGPTAHEAVPLLSATALGQGWSHFAKPISPLMAYARQELARRAAAILAEGRGPAIDPGEMPTLLLKGLGIQLSNIVGRTLLLELNIARREDRLSAQTTEDRYSEFFSRLADPAEMLKLLRDYPVAARRLITRTTQWVDTRIEMIRHLCDDWAALTEIFSECATAGPLVGLRTAGDAHREGRAVAILTFESGFTLVYKPRSIAIEQHFGNLMRCLNQWGAEPPLWVPRSLDRHDHGWVEFVAPTECESEDELQRFYERQGAFLALLHAMEAVDFHFENVIARREHPVLIDLEALFHPRLPLPVQQEGVSWIANEHLAYSVLRVGLLPQRVWGNAGSEGVDVSGLGATAGQELPIKALRWEALGTDEMRVGQGSAMLGAGANRPAMDGATPDVLDYVSHIDTGFVRMCELLIGRRDDLLAPGGPIESFANDEIRAILRATQAYSTLLVEGSHPDVLRDGLDRDRVFDYLWASTRTNPMLKQVIAAERDDLLNETIPFFTTRPTSRDVWTSRGERIRDFFPEAAIDRVRRRIARLDRGDMERQRWFVRASLTALSNGGDRGLRTFYRVPENPPPFDAARLIDAAVAIGDRLDVLALRHNDQATWIGLALQGDKSWTLQPLGPDMYNGIAGVALFLAYLGHATGTRRHTELARAAWNTLVSEIPKMRAWGGTTGLFSGWGSVVYVASHLATLWDDERILQTVDGVLDDLPAVVKKDAGFDVINGSAGCIFALLSYDQVTFDDRIRSLVQCCAEHLIEHRQQMERGVAWHTTKEATRPLLGLSHGVSGIAAALAVAGTFVGDPRYEHVARAALEYERSLYSEEDGNWPDFRDIKGVVPPNPPPAGAPPMRKSMGMWCHGAPGVGISRLLMRGHIVDDRIDAELDQAIATTLRIGFGSNHSICHGDLGNLAFLAAAAASRGDRALEQTVERFVSASADFGIRFGWRSGVPLSVENPALMTGLAGTGLGLLHFAMPERIPSIAMLDGAQRVRQSKGGEHGHA
jgi:type 2 lantibiotic biosynthesis protein LanM